ncbi:glycoside hydrolase [Dyella terrae]|uniref:Glycoside hydrolase n=1 Tax=Dyella terrae TaxID=522259 RepID=A0ABY1YU32_9GAMM|nr:glycoside hydrolase [Dyella terrae]TBR39053.1 glycoside hydrolase [Dyella terrae]
MGDDPRWSSPGFDDSGWEAVDLTPAPGAHDGDVGITGYVAGWSRRGHAGYTGYAWYRIRVTVESDKGVPLAMSGPTLVDSTYQVYVNGKRLGGPGDFSGATPTAYSVRPTVFPLPSSGSGPQTYDIAFRVWMDPVDAGDESGGLHVAPVIGQADSIDHLVRSQWMTTFWGYVADGIEPLGFVVLAMIAAALAIARTSRRYGWMIAALCLLALLRLNQVLYYWGHFLSLRSSDIGVMILLRPLVLATWTLAWREWFRIDDLRWLGKAIAGLTAIYMLTAWIARPWFWMDGPHAIKAMAEAAATGARIAFAAIYAWIILLGVIRTQALGACLAALAAVLVGIGLFATEVNALGVPGIWFPYGIGVARGQYAYALFIPLMFGLLLSRIVHSARQRQD